MTAARQRLRERQFREMHEQFFVAPEYRCWASRTRNRRVQIVHSAIFAERHSRSLVGIQVATTTEERLDTGHRKPAVVELPPPAV